jgi:phage terminase small subunit
LKGGGRKLGGNFTKTGKNVKNLPENFQKLPDLSPKRIRFCEEYVVDLNGTQAAIRSGYSAKGADVQAIRLLGNATVLEYIEQLLAKKREENALSAQFVLDSLQKVAERCMTAEPVMAKVDGELVETGEYRFDSSGANRALELLGKHLGLFSESINVKHKFEDLSDDELEGKAKMLALAIVKDAR